MSDITGCHRKIVSTIQSIIVSAYSAPYEQPITNGLYTYTATEIVTCRLELSDGTSAIGWTHGEKIVFTAAERIAALLIGEELNAERLWAKMYKPKLFGRRGLEQRAISALDIAVWDGLGKQAGMSVHRLLGGYHSSVPAYKAGGYYGEGKSLEDLQREVSGHTRDGAKALKMKIGAVSVAEDLARIDAVREAIGPDVGLLVDVNNAYDRITAEKMAAALDERDIYWYEEPLSPDDLQGASELASRTRTPVASGENEYTLWGFRDLIDANAVDVINADAQILGGITEWAKCAHYAQAKHIPVAPHGDQEIHTQLVAAVPNGLIVEYYDNSLNRLKDVMFDRRLDLNPDGSITPFDSPGLGVEIQTKAMEPHLQAQVVVR